MPKIPVWGHSLKTRSRSQSETKVPADWVPMIWIACNFLRRRRTGDPPRRPAWARTGEIRSHQKTRQIDLEPIRQPDRARSRIRPGFPSRYCGNFCNGDTAVPDCRGEYSTRSRSGSDIRDWILPGQSIEIRPPHVPTWRDLLAIGSRSGQAPDLTTKTARFRRIPSVSRTG